jgi:DNA-binding transcriptional regulator YbjK
LAPKNPDTSARRPRDPQRKDRIAQAAVDVVATRGVERLTHRDVAQAAGVPVGSTTYYFATRDDLIEAALRISADHTHRRLREWGQGITSIEDVAPALADLVVAYTGPDRTYAVVSYELYTATIRRPWLTDVAMDWAWVMQELLEPLTDSVTAEALAVALDGALLRGLIGPERRRDELEAVFARIVAGCGR